MKSLPRFRAIIGASLAMSIAAVAQPSPKRPLINGTFDNSPPGAPPAGWVAAYPQGSATVVKEGNDTFLRLVSTVAANAGMMQTVDVPPKAKTVSVLGRMRGKPENEKKETRARVEVCLMYKNPDGGNINAAVVASENSPNWHTFKRDFTLPAGCEKVEVSARSLFAIGTFDFDEVRLEFK
jgi:hypothetical protein